MDDESILLLDQLRQVSDLLLKGKLAAGTLVAEGSLSLCSKDIHHATQSVMLSVSVRESLLLALPVFRSFAVLLPPPCSRTASGRSHRPRTR